MIQPIRNRTKLTASQQELAARYRPLAVSLAQRVARHSGLEWMRWGDELRSRAFFHLTIAARDFDPKYSNFSKFASRRIIGGIRRKKLFDPSERLAISLDLSSGLWPVLYQVKRGVPHEVVEVMPLDLSEDVESALKSLPANTAKVLRVTFLEGRSQTEAAKILGCSQPEICRQIEMARMFAGNSKGPR